MDLGGHVQINLGLSLTSLIHEIHGFKGDQLDYPLISLSSETKSV